MSDLHGTLRIMVKQLASGVLEETDVIPWASTVPAFGEPDSRVATLGLNPSRQEFVDRSRNPLRGNHRRLHTLESLGLTSWSEAGDQHLGLIWNDCRSYFSNKPYWWFRRLNKLLSGIGVSYYAPSHSACHLDLVPYATENIWSRIAPEQQSRLLNASRDTLALILRNSSSRVLVLNGRSVVEFFQSMFGLRLEEAPLRLLSGWGTQGYTYTGRLDTLAEVELGREVLVLGFNHYIQRASYEVSQAVTEWIRRSAE